MSRLIYKKSCGRAFCEIAKSSRTATRRQRQVQSQRAAKMISVGFRDVAVTFPRHTGVDKAVLCLQIKLCSF